MHGLSIKKQLMYNSNYANLYKHHTQYVCNLQLLNKKDAQSFRPPKLYTKIHLILINSN